MVADDGVTVLLDNEQESSIAMKDSTAWYINYMLRNAMINGTGTYARFDGMTMAGKTGTTSSRKDLYFAGYTPYYTAAAVSYTHLDVYKRQVHSLLRGCGLAVGHVGKHQDVADIRTAVAVLIQETVHELHHPVAAVGNLDGGCLLYTSRCV